MASILNRPFLPAIILLFGMVYCLAFSHFSGLRWNPYATITFYFGLFCWVGFLALNYCKGAWKLGFSDKLFAIFLLIIAASVILHGEAESVLQTPVKFLPFMVLLPYVCGRLLRTNDVLFFLKILVWLAPVLFFLLLADYWINLTTLDNFSRWPFFGYDHTTLLVGMIFANALIAYVCLLSPKESENRVSLWVQLGLLVGLGLVSLALVGVAARGALLGGVAGICVALLLARYTSGWKRAVLAAYVFGAMIFSFYSLPKQQVQAYVNLGSVSVNTFTGASDEYAKRVNRKWDGRKFVTTKKAKKASPPDKLDSSPDEIEDEPFIRDSLPVLGEESCEPIDKGIDSLAIRWLLYREAVQVFLNNPMMGVGPSFFGRVSCAGTTGFPHSTVLQSFAELGILGGVVYCGLLLIAFFGLLKKFFTSTNPNVALASRMVLPFCVLYFLADQLYGNFLMAVGSFFFLGVASAIQMDEGDGSANA